ncbi:hypothetical protein ACNI65_11395 [Roseateles sp. So40a]|uniref:hypothetical protein n=1 Tax=Roseateles sp. So40a TaxID=3400226 RepID=UPI003A86759F
MGRRFGRNQRRRAREDQAQLAAKLQKVSDTLAFAATTAIERGHTVHELTCEIAAAKAMLARRSALMRPEGWKFGGEPVPQVHLDPFFDESPDTDHQLDAAMLAQPVSFERVPLDVLLTDVDRDYLKQRLHARVQFASADLYYAISPAAISSMRGSDLADRLATEIARQLAPALMRELGLERWPEEPGL